MDFPPPIRAQITAPPNQDMAIISNKIVKLREFMALRKKDRKEESPSPGDEMEAGAGVNFAGQVLYPLVSCMINSLNNYRL